VKYALLADIHANLEALDAVLRDQQAQGCTHMACLGDIVGYCADPKECVDIIRALNIPVVKGNHDEYVGTDMLLEGFNSYAARAVEWTRKQLTEDDRRWLRELPLVLHVEDFVIVHASLDDPQRWVYVFDKLAAAISFARQKTEVCFFGHTHVPMAFIRDSVVRGGTYSMFKVDAGRKYFINPGSVGQSRDGVPKATYAIYDLEERTVELRRVDYDIAQAQTKIRKSGLPPRLSER
jgi:diadenosine tetraphosphatase ApaH/serine/threonine PP2A family protein phosphatase